MYVYLFIKTGSHVAQANLNFALNLNQRLHLQSAGFTAFDLKPSLYSVRD